VQLLLLLHVVAGQQYESFVGCFKDNGKRDFAKLKKGDLKKGNAIEECRKWAKSQKKKYFALQVAVQCFADDDYGTPWSDYFQLPVSKCVRKGWRCGNGEHMSYCGGGWANAVYTTEPTMPVAIKVGLPMQIISPWKMTSLCMYAQASDKNVYMKSCTYRNNKKYPGEGNRKYLQAGPENFLWVMKGKTITTPSMQGMCLENSKNGKVYMKKCNKRLKGQKWLWKDGATLKSELGLDDKGKGCLDWHLGNNDLYIHKECHQGENQNFWWNQGKEVEILKGVSGKRKYLSTTWQANKVDLWIEDDGSGRQHWKFVKVEGKNTYNIKVTNGINANRGNKVNLDNAFLSCNSDGSVVDIWGQGLGKRQRWVVKELKNKKGFEITVAGDVKGARKYLSTTQNGNKVDLWIKNDGSGRQVWKLHGSQVPTPKPTPVPTPRPTPVPVRNLKKAGGFRVVKGYPKCTISIEDGADFPCAVSPNYGKTYGREIDCVFELKGKKSEFVTLSGSTEKYFDPITVSGKQYSGKLTAKKIPVKGNIKWTADFFEGTKGWKICRSGKPQLKIELKDKPKKGKPKKGKPKKGKPKKGRRKR